MNRLPLTLLLVSGLLSRSADAGTFPTRRQDSELEQDAPQHPRLQLCNFNEGARTYGITDLLLCMEDLAKNILSERNASEERVSNRLPQDEDNRQSYPVNAYPPDYSQPWTNPVAPPNNYPLDTISSLLTGDLSLSSLPNLFGFGSSSRPGFNLLGALSSIARFDDLKCIPRILCEVASGSIPGSYGYRQNSAFQDSGLATLFRLFTAFDIGASPILTFGRAALIGYTHRGNSYSCYREYPRCPQNPNQLISYLNTHNGGFFRFFNSHLNNNNYNNNYNNYYRPPHPPQPSHPPYPPYPPYHPYATYPPYPPYSPYPPIYKNTDLRNKNTHSNPEYGSLQTVAPEDDQTGTGKLTFDNNNDPRQKNDDAHIFSLKNRESDSGKILFPKDNRESLSQSPLVAKSSDVLKDLIITNDENTSIPSTNNLFYQNDDERNIDPTYTKRNDYGQKSRIDIFGNERKNFQSTNRTSKQDALAVVFPDN